LRDAMEREILRRLPDVKITNAEVERLPNTSSLVIPGIDGEVLLMNLDMEGISVSTGAACSSGSQEPSPGLLAMGLSRQEAQSSLRVSLGWDTSGDDIGRFVETLCRILDRLKKLNPSNIELRESKNPV
jgi:cysteine desulfurase